VTKDRQAALIDSINESTKNINTFTLTFFATCIYVAIAVASTSHEALLLGSEVHLPLLNVEVPLGYFFVMAPLIVFFLHLHLLLQEYFLFCKLKYLKDSSLADGVAVRFFPGFPVNSYVGKRYRSSVQLLLRFLRFAIHQILPLFLLCWIQVRFLPYHGWGKTFCHQVLVVLDILLISYYSRKLSLLREVPPAKWQWIPMSLRAAVRRAVLFATAIFSLFYAVVPGTWMEYLLQRPMPYADWLDLSRNLSLREKMLVSQHPAPELLAARDVTRDKLDALYLELARGMNLVERDLRFADFTGSKLFNADLRGADLRGAILVNADLRGAKLMPTGGSDGLFDLPPDDVKLARIDEVAQDPETYKPVRLAGANLRDADLRGAKLILADLAGADLNLADLSGAELSRSHLEFANLADARLTGSKLFHAILVGADLRGAHLEGADFSNARLDGANFAGAHLEAAEFKDATSKGAVFWNASLQGATSLFLDGAILRQAKMRAIDLCKGRNANGPWRTDLRDVDFTTSASWYEIETRLGDSLLLKEPRERKDPCLKPRKSRLPEDMAHRLLLYSVGPLPEPMKDWPPLAQQGPSRNGIWGETEFFAALADNLWDQACNDRDSLLARALVKRILDGYSPAEPLLNKHLADQLKKRQRPCPRFEEIEERGELPRSP
jgi:uncharacterized protein YjbI with pentapeptide repeats